MLYKYPRTPHLPFSESVTNDDRVLNDISHFLGCEIVITEKMDGENTTIYKDYYHARSLDSKHRDYHSWLLSYIRNFQYLMPKDYRICGEYLYAKHSIAYDNLESYFQVFSVWNDNICLNWDDTKKFISDLGLQMVPELYVGVYDENIIKNIAKEVIEKGGEGIVIRKTNSFSYNDFDKNLAKYVRPNHVQTDKHWSNQEIICNKMIKSN